MFVLNILIQLSGSTGNMLDMIFSTRGVVQGLTEDEKKHFDLANRMTAKAGSVGSSVVHNEHVQRYATREGMRWCCSFLCREFFRRS